MSYVIKVKNDSSRADANYIKYWVDSYEYVGYRGLTNVLHVMDGNTDVFITDGDRGNWDVIALTANDTPTKPLDFTMDRYIWDGKGAALTPNITFVTYSEFDNNVRINNATDYSISGAALWVIGGVYVGKTLFVNNRLNVADNLIAQGIDSPIVINSVSNATLNTTQTAINNKGAMYLKGGLSVERDIVANNIFLKGMIDAKSGIKFGNISSNVVVSDTRDATLVDASIITQGGLTVIKNIRCAGMIYGDLTGNVTGNVTGTAGGVAWDNVTSKPAVVINNGSIYNISISGRLCPSVSSGSTSCHFTVSRVISPLGESNGPTVPGSGVGYASINTGINDYPYLLRVISTTSYTDGGKGVGVECSLTVYSWYLITGASFTVSVGISGNYGGAYGVTSYISYQFIPLFI